MISCCLDFPQLTGKAASSFSHRSPQLCPGRKPLSPTQKLLSDASAPAIFSTLPNEVLILLGSLAGLLSRR